MGGTSTPLTGEVRDVVHSFEAKTVVTLSYRFEEHVLEDGPTRGLMTISLNCFLGGKGGGSEYVAESGRGGGSGAVSVSLNESDSCKRRILMEFESRLGNLEDWPKR